MSYLRSLVAPYYDRDFTPTVADMPSAAERVYATISQAQQIKQAMGGTIPLPEPGKGNYITWGGATLAPQAMQSFMSVASRFGGIPLSSSYRSIAQQAALYRDFLAGKHPAQVAPPGKSLHNHGLAIDVNSDWLRRNPGARKALLRAGWYQFDPVNEPWHFSFGRVG